MACSYENYAFSLSLPKGICCSFRDGNLLRGLDPTFLRAEGPSYTGLRGSPRDDSSTNPRAEGPTDSAMNFGLNTRQLPGIAATCGVETPYPACWLTGV